MKDVQITSTLNPLPKYESSSCSRSRSTQKKESQWKVKETSKERQRNAKTISKFWNWGKVNAEQRLGSEVANNPKKAITFTSQPDFWLKKMTLWKSSLKLCKENYISTVELIERNFSMLDERASKSVLKAKHGDHKK